MILYLCRHAIAAEAQDGDDAARPLTAEGVKKFRRAARGFFALEPEVGHIVSSPLLRAQQTAEILAMALEKRGTIVGVSISASLGEEPNLKKLLSEVRDYNGNVAAVGHEPTLSKWIGELCFDAAGRCEMKKGAIAAIELNGERGTLLWIMQSGQLRALG
jgi:phosphohistidine phosphatase